MALAFKERDKLGQVDLESMEVYIRSRMHSVGGRLLEELLNSDGGDYRGKTIVDGERAFEFKEYRDKGLLTVLGPVSLKRAYYYNEKAGAGRCPKDKALDVEGTSFSPGVRRITGRMGAYRTFGLGADDIKEMAGIDVTAKQIERISHSLGQEVEEYNRGQADLSLSDKVIPLQPAVPVMYICMDGTGVPVVKTETANRRGKGKDGQAKTREAKLGCVFTSSKLDAATQIIDLYHARQHYWDAARAAFGADKEKIKQWTSVRRKELEQGKVEEVIEAIRQLLFCTDAEKELLEKEIGYFEKNKERMRYADFRKQGFFVGSGVLEAGCRTVVGQRLKQSGMHWTVKGANNIIALRCCFLSNRWEDFWEYRAAAA